MSIGLRCGFTFHRHIVAGTLAEVIEILNHLICYGVFVLAEACVNRRSLQHDLKGILDKQIVRTEGATNQLI